MGRPVKYLDLPTIDRINGLLEFCEFRSTLKWKKRDPSTFTGSVKRSSDWKAAQWNSRFAGNDAGGIRPHGYHMIMIDGVHYMTHRIIWKMKTGEEPVQIDHIDGNRENNSFSNLRSVEHSVNMKNKSLYVNNKSGTPGVRFHRRDGVWEAKIGVDGGQIQLGSFETKQEAIAARIAGEIVLKYHENHGRQKINKES